MPTASSAAAIEGEHLAATQALVALVGDDDTVPIVQIAGLEGGEGVSTVAHSLAASVVRSMGVGVHHIVFTDRVDQRAEDRGADGVQRTVMPLRMIRRIVSDGLLPLLDTPSNRPGLVLVETPPLLTAVEGAAISGKVRGTILVAEADRTTYAAMRAGRDAIARADGKIFGVVLNKRRYDVPRPIARALGIPMGRLRRPRAGATIMLVLGLVAAALVAFLALTDPDVPPEAVPATGPETESEPGGATGDDAAARDDG